MNTPRIVVMFQILAALVFGVAGAYAQETAASASTSSATATSQKAETEFDGVSAEVTAVKRTEGDALLVQFKYTNAGAKKVRFEDSNFHHENLAALVYYIDGKNKKKYTVIEDTDRKPVASDIRELVLEPGASKSAWCKLPAPPADVTTVTLVIPGAPPFEKISIAPAS